MTVSVSVFVSAADVDANIDLNDPRLIEAMEMFGNMSPDEMKETMNELRAMLGDDPKTVEAINQVMNEIQTMDKSQIQGSLQDMVEQDEIRVAMKDALEMLKDGQWDVIWEHRMLIRDAVIDSGKISPDDAAKFKTDDVAWEKELKFIWNELQKQANAMDASGDL